MGHPVRLLTASAHPPRDGNALLPSTPGVPSTPPQRSALHGAPSPALQRRGPRGGLRANVLTGGPRLGLQPTLHGTRTAAFQPRGCPPHLVRLPEPTPRRVLEPSGRSAPSQQKTGTETEACTPGGRRGQGGQRTEHGTGHRHPRQLGGVRVAAAGRGEGGGPRLQTLLPKKKLVAKEPLTALPLGGGQNPARAGIARGFFGFWFVFLLTPRSSRTEGPQGGSPAPLTEKPAPRPPAGRPGVGAPRGVSRVSRSWKKSGALPPLPLPRDRLPRPPAPSGTQLDQPWGAWRSPTCPPSQSPSSPRWPIPAGSVPAQVTKGVGGDGGRDRQGLGMLPPPLPGTLGAGDGAPARLI